MVPPRAPSFAILGVYLYLRSRRAQPGSAKIRRLAVELP